MSWLALLGADPGVFKVDAWHLDVVESMRDECCKFENCNLLTTATLKTTLG